MFISLTKLVMCLLSFIFYFRISVSTCAAPKCYRLRSHCKTNTDIVMVCLRHQTMLNCTACVTKT